MIDQAFGPRGNRRGGTPEATLELHACAVILSGPTPDARCLSLPLAWCGAWSLLLAGLILFEIVVTMTDFAIEVRTRGQEGVAAGERITHALMAIVYGAMLGRLAAHVFSWSERATSFASLDEPAPSALRRLLLCMALGVFLSGVRDAYAALGVCQAPRTEAGPKLIFDETAGHEYLAPEIVRRAAILGEQMRQRDRGVEILLT